MHRAPVVAVLYLAITLATTWPIVKRDSRATSLAISATPRFVTGVLAWGSDHWMALVTGDIRCGVDVLGRADLSSRARGDGVSEHLALHSLLTLPVYARDAQSGALLQPLVSCDVLPQRVRDVPAGARPHRTPRRRVRRRTGVRLRAVPHQHARAPAGAVDALDAVRPSRPPSVPATRAIPIRFSGPARRYGPRTCRAAIT